MTCRHGSPENKCRICILEKKIKSQEEYWAGYSLESERIEAELRIRIESLRNITESATLENQKLKDLNGVLERDNFNAEANLQLVLAEIESLKAITELQKVEIDRLLEREYNEYPRIILDLETRIFDLQDAANTQESIIELAVKGLEEIRTISFSSDTALNRMLEMNRVARSTASEIERLQNEQT